MMKPRVFSALVAVWLAPAAFLPGRLLADDPANLIINGGFERFSTRENLWDGVDSDGYLAGERRSSNALTESGSVSDLPMPLSVNFADINGDGLPDLVTVDPAGFFRAYINSGTKTEPKFTHAEMIPLFLSRHNRAGAQPWDGDREARFALKANLHDWGRRGVLDLTVADYAGDVFFLPNSGTPSAPEWRQPRTVEELELKTSKGGEKWGNLFAPAAWDFDKDGRTDLLLGEGSYSANAVHLLLNKGAGSRPDFSGEGSRSYLVYGDGREQLTPAVADFNGDGQPDVVVGDRKGTVGLYLNPGGWKPGTELPLTSMLSFGSVRSLGGCISLSAGDWNGDGLVDLVIGKTNGRIAVALNTGTKEQPKFDPPFEVKGQDLWGRTTQELPNTWGLDTGSTRGNLYGYVTTVDATRDPQAAPPEGTRCLKAGYYPSPNKVFKIPSLDIPPNEAVSEFFDVPYGTTHVRDAVQLAHRAGTHTFVLEAFPKTQLKVGASYLISFKVKGSGVRDARYSMAYRGHIENAPAKIERGERNSAKITRDETYEKQLETGTFSPGAQWTAVTKTFQCQFKDPNLKKLDLTTSSAFEIRFTLPTPESVIYIDDVQIVPKS